jgi:hypothetical protein
MFRWVPASGAAAIYCFARAIMDLRRKRYVRAAVGSISAAILLLTPAMTHPVKADLPFRITEKWGWRPDGLRRRALTLAVGVRITRLVGVRA